MSKKLLGYFRKSNVDGPTASPERQRHAIETWAQRNGFSPDQIRWFGDLDVSGKNEANRADWQRLIGCLDDPGVVGVAVESYDRSHRNVRQFLAFYDDQLAPRGLKLISATQNMDLSTADGRFMATVMMAYAENEAHKAGERMAATIRYKQEILGRHWGKPPFGCDRDPKTLHLIPSTRFYYYNPATGEALAAGQTEGPPGFEIRYFHDSLLALFQLHGTAQYSYNDTANMLNAAGWRIWHKGAPRVWTFKDVNNVTRRADIYAGRLGGRPAGHEPILPVELCEAVLAARRVRSGIRHPGNNGKTFHTYLLSGILRCDSCGSRMGGQRVSGQGSYYRHIYYKAGCKEQMIPLQPLEEQVIDMLMPFVNDQLVVVAIKNLRIAVQQVVSEQTGGEDGLARLSVKEAELERLIELRIKNLITIEQFEWRQQAIQAEIAELRMAMSDPDRGLDIDALAAEIVGDLHGLPEASRERQKAIIQRIVSEIRVSE